MNRTIYYTASSLDGFIAAPGHDLAWLVTGDLDTGSDDSPFAYPTFESTVGAVVMGANTYKWVIENTSAPTPESWYRQPTWIVTHRTDLPPITGASIRYFAGDVAELHPQLLDAAGGGDVWVVGGGDLAGQFLDAGLLDEIVVTYAPVTLGAGSPLLPRRAEWRLVESARMGDFAATRWTVARM